MLAAVRDAILRRQAGLLTYGITPPKRSYSARRRQRVALAQTARINALPIDGLVVYDLQDESGRTGAARPFPFIETVDPLAYAYEDLRGVEAPRVVYSCVAPLEPSSLTTRLREVDARGGMTVLVGAASSRQKAALRLSRAYELYGATTPRPPLGGVLIAERHASRGGEDLRALRKMDAGCSFFISQAVYSVVATKDVLSDLYYRARAAERPVPPVLITLSPCGSLKTLAFLRWLGVVVPRWLENELTHAHDTLELSIDLCADMLRELQGYAASKGIPLGCNVESVSLRKAEIDASVELVRRARQILGDAEPRS